MMKDSTDYIAFYDTLSVEQAAELRRLLAADPAAAELVRNWRSVRAAIRKEMEREFVDRNTFTLFVLAESGHAGALTIEERDRVRQIAPSIRMALGRREALASIAADMKSDAEAFDAMWDEWFDVEDVQTGRSRKRFHTPSIRAERSAVPASRGTAPRSRRSSRWATRAAIGTAVVVFAALLTLVGRRDMASVTITTGPDEVRLVDLGGGSAVRILGSSRLTYVPPDAVSPLDRQTEFDGNGFFDIAPDARGYVVKTPNAQAVVVGTSFGIQSSDDETRVVLAEGRLALSSRSAPDQSVVLEAGQMSRVAAAGGPSAPTSVQVHQELAWTGLFVFQAVPLRDILAQLSDHYGARLSADEGLREERVTGRFDQEQELAEILDVVAAAIGGRTTRDGDTFHIAAP